MHDASGKTQSSRSSNDIGQIRLTIDGNTSCGLIESFGTTSALYAPQTIPEGMQKMDLSFWIPLTVILGLAAMAAMFAFVWACDKI
jgi:hypothetical protein